MASGAARPPRDRSVRALVLKPAATESLRHANAAEIVRFAGKLVGMSPRQFDLPPLRARAYARGDYGCRIELIFGLDCGGSPLPDFPTAGIELKTTKLRLQGRLWQVGERTTLQMIDYVGVGGESWSTASVRKKLDNLLFCFYRWRPDKDVESWPVDTIQLWRPDAQQAAFLEDDWKKIHAKIKGREAHMLSESDTHLLGAATKAATGAVRRAQVAGGPPAKPRAFALKQPFVAALYESFVQRPARLESLMRNLAIARPSDFEKVLLGRFEPFIGRRISEVAAEFGVAPSSSKSYTADVVRTVVKRLMGVRDPRSDIREFKEFGIEIKVVPVKASGVVKESMSFAGFRHRDLILQDWDTSEFRLQTDRLLIVPIREPARGVRSAEWTLGRPFFWSPDSEQEGIMRSEWSRYRRLIATGHADDLPTAAETRMVHVRPKARDSTDTDDAPIVGPVVKKCFWLNSHFVQELIDAQSG
jgi:DNA mismatch repair protein MutH